MNDYWSQTLANYSSLDSSMQFFRDMFARLHACTSPQCKCVLDQLEPYFVHFRTFNYSLFFLNEPNFTHMKQISQRVREKYPLRSAKQINADRNVYVRLDSSTPVINEYCRRYDWPSLASFYYFDRVRRCLPSRDRLERAMESCLREPVEKLRFVHTIASLNCSRDIKKYIALGMLTWSWDLVENATDLSRSIDSIVDFNFSRFDHLNKISSLSRAHRIQTRRVLELLSFIVFFSYF